MDGKVNRTTCLDGVLTKSEAHQSEGGLISLYHSNVGMATAQFRFHTPQLVAGSFILQNTLIYRNTIYTYLV
jgi:hypothetical protein